MNNPNPRQSNRRGKPNHKMGDHVCCTDKELGETKVNLHGLSGVIINRMAGEGIVLRHPLGVCAYIEILANNNGGVRIRTFVPPEVDVNRSLPPANGSKEVLDNA